MGLSIEIPHRVEVGGTSIEVPLLLRDFGARRGMLLVTDFDLIREHADDLVHRGCGSSCLAPTDRSHPEYDEAFLEMLADRGWSGRGAPPSWHRGRA